MARTDLQQRRAWVQAGFFALFVLAPVLDILRIDLTRGHAVLLGMDWTLGIDEFVAGRAGVGAALGNLLWRGFLPLFGGAGLLLWVAWRYGRLYCGWLCPHFSVVELINDLMRRAIGRPSLWDRHPVPRLQPDGTLLHVSRWFWLPTLLAVAGFAFIWAVVLLSYLLPPTQVYGNLISGTLTRNQAIFLGVATALFSVEFLLARHLFCRFACAVGLFQSLAWMSNDKAMVVGFDVRRADTCRACNNACDNACPMRLKPRTLKRKMFTCTECAACVSACDQVQGDATSGLLRWVAGSDALPVITGRAAKAAPTTHPPTKRCAAAARARTSGGTVSVRGER